MIVGCGYVGGALGERLVADGHEVFGMRRDASQLPAGIEPLRADVTRFDSIGRLPGRLDSVVYAVAAKARDEAAYRGVYLDGLANMLRALEEEGQRPRRIVFTSSTSVYAQSAGEWVDERSPTHPRRFPGQIMLAAERLLAAAPVPGTVIRLAGIYGPGRTSLIERVRGGMSVLPDAEPHYTNRIHRDDAAGAIAHLLGLDEPDGLYLGVDDEPADRAVVLAWLAERLGVELQRIESPPAGSDDGAPLERSGSKRCRNARLRDAGYVFTHPTFREGYSQLLER